MKKHSIFAVLFIFCSFFLWGEYFYQDGPEISSLAHICRRMGRALPFSSFPVHGSDILDLAEKLAADPGALELSDADMALLEGLISQLDEQQDGGILLKGGIALTYEQRFHTDPFTIDDTTVMANAEDFRRAFLNFSPVLRAYAGGGTFTGIYVGGQIDLGPSWQWDYSPDSNFFKSTSFNYDLFKKGILAWNGTYLNFFFGRDSIHWGNPQGSSLYPSALLPYMDSIRLNVPLGPFSFDYMLGTIIPKKAPNGYAKDVYDYDKAPPGKGMDPGEQGFIDDDNPRTILVVTHRFQWNFGSVKAGIGGTVVAERRDNMFLITDIVPLSSYHNADVNPNNLSFLLDVSWTPLPGFSLSAMGGFDDISGRTFGFPDDNVPTIPGAVVQAEYSRAGQNSFMHFMFEGGYTNYLWGNFGHDKAPYNDSSKYDTTTTYVRLARAIYRYASHHDAVLLPLTSPYGPGALWGKLRADLEFGVPGDPSSFWHGGIKAGAELLVLAKNSSVNLVSTPYKIDNSLAAYDTIFVALDLPFSYTWRSLELSVSPAFLFGPGDFSLECTLGLRWRLDGRTFLGD
jgi:hypothetical protein